MRNRGKAKKSKIKEVIVQHIKKNLREYAIVLILFLIGLIFGIVFINNVGESQINDITSYLGSFIDNLKNKTQINQFEVLKDALLSNFLLALILWFVGSTVIGIPIVYGIVIYRGFCLGYTISSIIATIGIGKGILFSFTSLLFQNLLFIPCLLALAVSGMKLYQSIVKDKRRENIKIEITRHTIFCFIFLIGLEIAAFAEVYISTNLLQICSKYL